MSAAETKVDTKPLHLPSLTITGFRGINELAIRRLGRVTLLAGKNGVGKTTILEAIQLFAARGRSRVVTKLLWDREELTESVDEYGEEALAPNWDALFYRRQASPDASYRYVSPEDQSFMQAFSGLEGDESKNHSSYLGCVIGPTGRTDQLRIRITAMTEEDLAGFSRGFRSELLEEDWRTLRIRFGNFEHTVPLSLLRSSRPRPPHRRNEAELPSEIVCESLGPSVLSNADMARFWNPITLTEDETRAIDALRLVYGHEVERATLVGGQGRPRAVARAIVKLKGDAGRVPLKSLGDGAVRIFAVALALANSRNGFLVIDEAENGIHHSVQSDFWRMILKTAHVNNVQVLATTHGWNCVAGFAQAATELEEVDAALVRLQRLGDEEPIGTVEYTKADLTIAAEQGIEVR